MLFSSCKSGFGQSSKKVTTLDAKDDSLQVYKGPYYFPFKPLKDTSLTTGLAPFVNAWYSEQLSALKEPVLYNTHASNEVYRFTWLRTFHNPIAIRIEKTDTTYMIYWKLCDGAGGYNPGKLKTYNHKAINKSIWEKFKIDLNQINFWNLQQNDGLPGYDGAMWVLEGKTSEKYHFVERWSPNLKSKYYQCCDFLISLTDLKINEKNKY